jgi:hypothetical protein
MNVAVFVYVVVHGFVSVLLVESLVAQWYTSRAHWSMVLLLYCSTRSVPMASTIALLIDAIDSRLCNQTESA